MFTILRSLVYHILQRYRELTAISVYKTVKFLHKSQWLVVVDTSIFILTNFEVKNSCALCIRAVKCLYDIFLKECSQWYMSLTEEGRKFLKHLSGNLQLVSFRRKR